MLPICIRRQGVHKMRTETAREQYRREVVLLLVVVWDLSYQYAALALGVPIGTVMSRLFLAAARPASQSEWKLLASRARGRIFWRAGRPRFYNPLHSATNRGGGDLLQSAAELWSVGTGP